MTTKELIRAEIERRIEWLNTATTDFAEGRRAELRSLYDFINALPDEPVEKTCKSCVFYENDCPFTRDKFMPYPNRVCKDYTFSTLKAEQEPESEDERIRKHLVDMVKRETGFTGFPSQGQVLAYLEKQKEQNPVEWSEEDERIRKAILGFLNPDKGGTKYSSNAELVEWSDWLKSLRPQGSKDSLQTHWKPSEEQMKAFKGYIEDFQARAEAAVGGWNNFDVMIRLYEQLKSL